MTTPRQPKPPSRGARATSPGRAPAAPPPARTARELREATVAARRRARPETDTNPLRQGLRLERVPDPCAFVLFGATGDLAHRKVVPALYQLWRTNLLPSEFSLVAVARRPYTDKTFAAEVKASVEKYSRVQPIDEEAWAELAKRITYLQLDFGDDDGFDRLDDRLDELDKERGTAGNRLFYLATQPSQVTEIVRQMGRVGLDHELRGSGWRRVVVEKPFGRDFESARHLNHEVQKVFRESQVYRIDHYLGKETVRNLLVFRFGNGIFEPVWNRSFVDHVQITVAESLGVEGRGAFYEETGASRDILQNHLLQLMALVAMEPPTSFSADALRDQKLQVLRAITTPDYETVRGNIVRGQYGGGWVQGEPVPGYREEPEVDPESETETYVAGKFTIDDWRWSGVPFYLRAGKRLPKRATEISIQCRCGSSATRPAIRRRMCWRCASSRTKASCCASRPRYPAWGSTSGP
jgi:glucose-6-phosphate 1-dehydrogenase